MKKLAGAVLLLCACAGLVFAQTQMSPAATPAKGPSVAQGVKQLEHDWLDAMKEGNEAELSGGREIRHVKDGVVRDWPHGREGAGKRRRGPGKRYREEQL